MLVNIHVLGLSALVSSGLSGGLAGCCKRKRGERRRCMEEVSEGKNERGVKDQKEYKEDA